MGCVWRGMLARELVFDAGEEGGRGIEGSVRVLHDVWSISAER